MIEPVNGCGPDDRSDRKRARADTDEFPTQCMDSYSNRSTTSTTGYAPKRWSDDPWRNMTTGEAEQWRRGWEAALAAIPHEPTQEWRRMVWENMEENAEVGNMKPGHILGNGYPDLMWRWARAAIAAMEPPA